MAVNQHAKWNGNLKTLDSLRVAVTAGAGFIGSFLCERLVEENHEVIYIDKLLHGPAPQCRAFARAARILNSCGTT